MNLIKYIINIILFINLLLSQYSVDGFPYSKTYNSISFQTITLPEVNNALLVKEDSYREYGKPYRYGHKHKVNYSPNNSGEWTKLPDGGKLWKINFYSKNAYAISLELNEFYISKGGKLYIYNNNYETILGAYTDINNSDSKEFSTPLISGDNIFIEYYEPKNSTKKNPFIITDIIHDYRDILNFSKNARNWECGVNVICESGYQGPINSVAFLDMGGFICSGAMVNNVRQDLTPYFLTAWHCIDGDNPNTFRFYFNKIASSCENTWGSSGSYAYSSNLVAHSDGISHEPNSESPGGDWALLMINDEIKEEWEVFYAGWDVTENYPIISCGVHHPGGTPKKINYDDDTAYGAWWDNANHGLTHWQVNWDEGGSEGGSSGSPIFNERFQIVGVLSGGAGECGSGFPDLYGKLNLGWNWEMEPNRRLIDWLDPDYTGTLIIDGTYVEVNELLGDLNSDEMINILDIIQLANLILNEQYTQNADLNNDNNLNILDIIQLANIILES